MEKEQNFKLIDGIFEPEDALKVVSAVINSKIKYHQLEDFSNHIRFNEAESHSKKRIVALENGFSELKNIIELSKVEGKKVKLNSQILIELV